MNEIVFLGIKNGIVTKLCTHIFDVHVHALNESNANAILLNMPAKT